MKAIQLVLFIGLLCVTTAARAEDRPLAEIVDYGIYNDEQNITTTFTNASAGSLLQSSGVSTRLKKQTTEIPARLGSTFGFRFVIHDGTNDAQVKLRLVWIYPEITDHVTGKKSTRVEIDAYGKPEDKNTGIMWTFTSSSELVPGDWTFQVFRDDEQILEKKFKVQKADEK